MDNDITIYVLIGTAVMLLLIAGFFVVLLINQKKKFKYHNEVQFLREQQQNQLIEAAVRSEEGERHRIAEQLHDEVGAILSSTRLHFSNIKTEQLDKQGQSLHEKSKVLLDESIQKVRSISHNLHSTLLKEFGLHEAIRHFMNKTVQGRLVKVETHLDPNYNIQQSQTDLGVYRIIQELVNNILKYAIPTFIHINSLWDKDILTVQLHFNGSGIGQQEFEELRYKSKGLGLKNIQNRIILLKGNILFEKKEKENWITLTIPTTEVA